MARKLCVNLTSGQEHGGKVCEALVVAIAAAASEVETLLFLGADGTRLSQKGYADAIREPGFSPAAELLASFARSGGKIWVCAPAFHGLQLDKARLIAGAELVGGGRLIEYLTSEGVVCISY